MDAQFECQKFSEGTLPKRNEGKWITNLSDRQLTKDEISVLEKGLNFARVPKEIPREEIIANVEASLRECQESPETIEYVRSSVANAIKKAVPPRQNLSTAEREAVRTLKKDATITTLPADKGNKTVVLNTVD